MPSMRSAILVLAGALASVLTCARVNPCVESTVPARSPIEVALVVTTRAKPFARSALPESPSAGGNDVSVDPSRKLQVIEGFGGAFNEQGWAALALLDEAGREAVLRTLFHPNEGLRFNICRTPIGASDYALDRYTLDETPDDYQMEHFSIDRDRQRLLPYIKAAMRYQPRLRVWGSAWTPPTWMKTNRDFDGGAMLDDPRIYAAYALYLAKFVAAYRAEGIDVFMVVPQNEPGQLTHYPSADWKPRQYVTFIRDHLGPTLGRLVPGTSIFVGTINTPTWNVQEVLEDPGASARIQGICFQWGGIEQLSRIHAAFPEKKLMQSETECGNLPWQPGFDPQKPQNDFAYAAHTWRKFRDFIAGGSSSYMLWNMVLDEQGKNIDRSSPWPQNAAVVVDRATKKVIYTPMFWATRHFSGLVDVGAELIESSGPYADRIAFANPDGSIIVELLNDGAAPRELRVAVGSKGYAVKLPEKSFATLIVPGAANRK
jgi:glucosylceramidase